MKRFYVLVSAVTLLMLVLSACGGKTAIPPASEVPATAAPATAAPATEAPATEAPATQTATEAPINVAGPPMQVGSTYRYVDGTLLVAVPGGPFIMGEGEAADQVPGSLLAAALPAIPFLIGNGAPDNPRHEVNVSDFWAYQTEVTNQQYAFCVLVGKCTPPDLNDNQVYDDPLHANDPVVGVDYDQSATYCDWVHGSLLTEAEWEKFASWDPEKQVKRIYPWGDAAPSCNLLNTANCVGEPDMVLNYPGGKSSYMGYGLAGNVFEWVSDFFSPVYYSTSAAQDPLGPEFGEKHSVRSTGFDRSFFESDSARRWSLKPSEHRNDLGFRCKVQDPTYFSSFCTAKRIYGLGVNGLPKFGAGSSSPCPATISFVMACGKNYTPYTTFQVNPPTSTFDNLPAGCGGGPPTWTCLSTAYDGTPVRIHNDCPVNLPPDYTCPMGFDPAGDGCSAQGKPGECLPGSTFDPVNQCCSAFDANGVQFGCPVGWYDTATGCAPFPAASHGSNSQMIPWDKCEKPGNTDGGNPSDGEEYGCTGTFCDCHPDDPQCQDGGNDTRD
jgi:sulfatase modifying factor 1